MESGSFKRWYLCDRLQHKLRSSNRCLHSSCLKHHFYFLYSHWSYWRSNLFLQSVCSQCCRLKCLLYSCNCFMRCNSRRPSLKLRSHSDHRYSNRSNLARRGFKLRITNHRLQSIIQLINQKLCCFVNWSHNTIVHCKWSYPRETILI